MSREKLPYHRCSCGRVQLRPYKRCLHHPKGGLTKSGLWSAKIPPSRIWRQLQEVLKDD